MGVRLAEPAWEVEPVPTFRGVAGMSRFGDFELCIIWAPLRKSSES